MAALESPDRPPSLGVIFLSAMTGSVLACAMLGIVDSVRFVASTSAALSTNDMARVLGVGLLAGFSAGIFGGVASSPLLWLLRRRRRRLIAVLAALLSIVAWCIDAMVLRNLYPGAHLLCGIIAVLAASLSGGVALTKLVIRSPVVSFIAVAGVAATLTFPWHAQWFIGSGHRVRSPLIRESTLIARVIDLLPGPELVDDSSGNCAFPAPERTPVRGYARQRPIMILTIDALRGDESSLRFEDHLPKIARWTSKAVVFERAYTAATRTVPSIFSLMTGRWAHRAEMSPVTVDANDTIRILPPGDPILLDPRSWRQRHEIPINDTSQTLAELLSDAGYHTGTTIPYVFFRREAGLTRGFQDIDTRPYFEGNYDNDGITSELLTDQAIAWLRDVTPSRPWFLWVHYMDPHAPYHSYGDIPTTAPPLTRYLGELRRVDDSVDRLLTEADRMGVLDDTVLVVTSDHGQEFGDHGGNYHGTTVFEEQARVALRVQVKGVTPRRVTQAVSLVDVTPTILDLVGVDTAMTFDGRSLWDLMRGRGTITRPVLALSTLHGRRAAIVNDDLKLIVDITNRSISLYNLAEDPHEQLNIADQRPQDVGRLYCLLQASGALDEID